MKIHKQLKNGFSLIEVIVAMLIGSMLILSLYQLLIQSQRSVRTINEVIDLDTPLLPLYNQLERDLKGVFVPCVSTKIPKKSEDSEQENQKQEEKKLANIFVSSGEKNKLSLNFITTGGLKRVDKTGALISEPYIKRVVYTLQPDKDQPGLYVLWYAQNENLDASTAHIQRYELAWRLKELTIVFKVYELPAPETDDKQEAEKKLITLTQFNSQEALEKYKTPVPAFVEIKGIITDELRMRELPFNFMFAIAQYPDYKKPSKRVTGKKASPQEVKQPATNSLQANKKPSVLSAALVLPSPSLAKS